MDASNPFPAHSSVKSSSTSEQDVMLPSENPKKRAGRKKFKETKHPIYRGVRSRDSGKWVCEVRHPVTQSRVWLRSHHVAVLALKGQSACLNFADSVSRLAIPETNDVREIVETQEIVGYVDREDMFGLSGFLDSMADAR